MKTPITPTIVQTVRQTLDLLRNSHHAGYIAPISFTVALEATLLLLISTQSSYQLVALAIASILVVILFLSNHHLTARLNRAQLVALFAALVQAIAQFVALSALIDQTFILVASMTAGCVVLASAGVMAVELVRLVQAERWATAFTSLSEAQLATLAARAERVTFRARSVLFRQDAAADRVYLLTHGEVELLQRDSEGVYAPVAQVEAGAWIGEAGLLGNTSYRTAAKAISEVEALVLDREVVASLLFGSIDVVALLPASIANDLPARIQLLRTAIQRLTRGAALHLLGSASYHQSYIQPASGERMESVVGSSKASAA